MLCTTQKLSVNTSLDHKYLNLKSLIIMQKNFTINKLFNNLNKVLFYLFTLLILVSCNQTSLEKDILVYHSKNYPTSDLSNGIEIITQKEIDTYLIGVFYKIKDSDKYFYGYFNSENSSLKTVKIRHRESISDFYNKGCLVNIPNNINSNCYSIFVGKIPLDGYTSIELEWNCSRNELEKQELIDGKYYYFIKENKDQEICNIRLTTNEGEQLEMLYDPLNGKWTEKNDSNSRFSSIDY
jgi:hypothetical protein